MAFPIGFLWGAATAAHQVEGGNTANDWAAWETDPNSPSAEVSGRACEHWTRYPADLDILAGMGLEGLGKSDRAIAELRSKGLAD